MRIVLISLILLLLQIKGAFLFAPGSQWEKGSTDNTKIARSSMIMMNTKRATGRKRMKEMKLAVKWPHGYSYQPTCPLS